MVVIDDLVVPTFIVITVVVLCLVPRSILLVFEIPHVINRLVVQNFLAFIITEIAYLWTRQNLCKFVSIENGLLV